MTTTTRTTRKAPWAAVLTALLAVLALLFGAMTMAAPATAKNDPDKTPPGQSEEFVPPGQDENFVPPGQENTPPGQNPGDTPGSSHDKLTICHKVEGLGETGAGWNIITMNEQAWAAHQAHHASQDFVVTSSTPCPPAVPTTYYCPADSTYPTTVLDGPYDAATDLATCYAPVVLTEAQAAAIDAAMAATAPEAVAPVEAATVTEEPETVAVPAPATVATPATVPAGDGSTVPQVPVALLALLALATAAAVTSGLRLATNR
jgi:hypothetical protein